MHQDQSTNSKLKGGLFVLHLRGKTNGAKVVSRIIAEKYSLHNKVFDVATRHGSSNGKISLQKLVESAIFYIKIIANTTATKYSFIYYSYTPHGLAQYRDIFTILSIKALSTTPITLHFHAEIKNSIKIRLCRKIGLFNKVHAITINELQKKNLTSITGIPSNKISVIPNRILNCNKVDYQQRIEIIARRIKKRRKIILCLSNFIEGKGIEDAIYSYEKIIRTNNSAYLIIAGNIIDRKYFEKISKLAREIDPKGYRIKIVINLHGKAKRKVFENAYTFLFPSKLNETFGIVNLEALEFGVPIVSYATPSSGYFIEHGKNGYIADSQEDFRELSNKIISQPLLATSMMRMSLERSKDFDIGLFLTT